MPMVSTTSVFSAATSRRVINFEGSVVPHIAVKRWICFNESTGMIPGTIGTVMPAARLSDPGIGLRDNGRRVLTYADLKSTLEAVRQRYLAQHMKQPA